LLIKPPQLKFIFAIVIFLFCQHCIGQQKPATIKSSAAATPSFVGIPSPLSSYSIEWTRPIYGECNTAEKTAYLTKTEKDLIYILNLARKYPELFLNTVVKKYPVRTGNTLLFRNKYYYQSLLTRLQKTRSLPILQPDGKCYESAYCHAVTSGEKGYTGHNRQTRDCAAKQYYNGECADYGHKEALDILMSLLIDQGVPSLGHRDICLTGKYTLIGVSIQPHIYFNYNAVLDFKIDDKW